MNRIEGDVIAILVFTAMLFGMEQWGEHTVQVEWDKDKAVRAAVLAAETKRNQETINDLKDQHAADLQAAKSEAGRAAVAGWLHDHGLLPSGLPLHPGAQPVPSQGSQIPDGEACQQGVGAALEGFATGCAQDALRLMDWQELCIRQQCEVE